MRSLLATLLILPLLSPGDSVAQGSTIEQLLKRKPQEIDGGRAGNLRERALKRLGKAQKLMSSEKYEDSLELLDSLEGSLSRNDYGLSQVYQTKGYVYAQSDRFPQAAKYLRKTVELKALPKAPLLNSIYSLAQVLVAQEKYLEAVPYIQDYLFNKEPARADAYFFYGQVLAQLKQIPVATVQVEKALSLNEAPKESWLRFLVALYYEQKLYAKAGVILEKLVKIDPKKTKYWKQLSSVYLAQDMEQEALSVLEVAEKNKVLNEEKDILQLVRLSLFQGVPYKAGIYLQEALSKGKAEKTSKHYELLAEAWVQAQELDRALVAFKKAAPLSKDGELFVRQGQLYLAKEDWKSSIDALSKGIEKGGLKREGLAHVALGVAFYSSGSTQRALDSFRKAKKFPKYKKQASEWIKHLNTGGAITH